MKKILGLDLGTNSIGWALVELDFENKNGNIIGIGSRIIPMSQDILGKFDSGVSFSQTAERTGYRSIRKLYQRDNLRRERLHRVLNILGFLPEHYARAIDFDWHLGQFKEGEEPKLNYCRNEEGRYEFIFKESFYEMARLFRKNGVDKQIPYDWTIYYLRKKALTQKISKEELTWVILNFNQKRGYYQLRGEETDQEENKSKEYCLLKVREIIDNGEEVKGKKLFDIFFENGWKYDKQTTKPEDWIGKTKEFIVTTSQIAKGEIKRTFKSVDSENDWIAIKTKTEQDINTSGKTVGEFIFESLLKNPAQKIRGSLIRTIERKFYKEELVRILDSQYKFHTELQSDDLYIKCIEELYPYNQPHKYNIKGKGFKYLFINDIIFYQRPLKSKKTSINKCTYEIRNYKKTVTEIIGGEKKEKLIDVKAGIKAIPKSHPLFQEFRLWQFINNIRIYRTDLNYDENITSQLLPDEDSWVCLFDFLNNRKEVEQKNIIDYFIKNDLILKTERDNYRWNYVEDKKYSCNETHSQLIFRFSKVKDVDPVSFLDYDKEVHLWHIIYSVKDKNEFEQALLSFAERYEIDKESFLENFRKIPPFPNDYGAYSQKALKKLLPLMRMGKYWNEKNIDPNTKIRIEKLINGEFDENIQDRVREKTLTLKNLEDFRGLPTWLACYVVYDRHSEANDIAYWETPQDIDVYLDEFKQHSLRNPIVEQVVTETLRVVRDIWITYGNSAKKKFQEIHIELGREMKNPADKRKQLANRVTENENTNQRVRELLNELMNDTSIEGDVRPYSPSHLEILKIYEEGIYQNPDAKYDVLTSDEVEKIRKNVSPSNSDIKKYKLWLEQGYRSPYTGAVIPLSKLFSKDYQIEHIIPQARYFDDSLSNKIICESEVNQLKSNKTAYEFLKQESGRIIDLSGGKTVKLFNTEAYEEHCKKYFRKNNAKLKKLLSEDVPEGFIERQLNDSRYISKLVKSLISNIVREDNESESTSKYILSVNGAITDRLKKDWGLFDKWNDIIAPRFKRLNELTNSNDFGFYDNSINSFRCEVPQSIKRGFSKKRIDHRHHALDALVIACTQRKHIQYLNSLNNEKMKYELRKGLLVKNSHGDFTQVFKMPWNNFPVDALKSLKTTIVSFKQNLRIINKPNNKILKWVEHNGQLKKQFVKQTKGYNWAIRKPLHKETVSGKVNIRYKKTISFTNGIKEWEKLVDKDLKKQIKKLVANGEDLKSITKYYKQNPYKKEGKIVNKLEIYDFTKNATASRLSLNDKFTRKQLENVTDSGIQKILEKHLKEYTDENGKEHFEQAYSPDGIDKMNSNIEALNDGKMHQPIKKVRVYEEGKKFNVGYKGNKASKYVEAAKGTNLFFSIYWNEDIQKREYETIPLNEVIEHQKQMANLPKSERTTVPVNKEKGQLLFTLSPSELVYVPTEEEIENPQLVDFDNLSPEQVERIYKMVSSTGIQCFFIQHNISNVIQNKVEYSVLNKMEKTIDHIMVKEKCWKLEINRLGKITNVWVGNIN